MAKADHLRLVDLTTGEADQVSVDDRILALTASLHEERAKNVRLREQIKEIRGRSPREISEDVQRVWDAYFTTAVSLNPRRRNMKLGPEARRAIELALKEDIWDADYLSLSVVGVLLEPYEWKGKIFDRPQHALLKKGVVSETKIDHFHDLALEAQEIEPARVRHAAQDAHLAQPCRCGHPRVDHIRPDLIAQWAKQGVPWPDVGLEPCAHFRCECEDFEGGELYPDQLRLSA